MDRRNRRRRYSSFSIRTDFSEENIDVNADTLESLLEEDGTFVEFFNAFLALPMFPIRLFYNPDVAYFEEFKHQLATNPMENDGRKGSALQRLTFFKNSIDNKGLKIGYYVKFLSKADGFDWVKKNRLPLFIKSELCAEYRLARVLSFAQTVYLMNILIDSGNLGRNALDKNSSPEYRTHRTRGRLPGLAEFQERLQLLQEGNEYQSSEVSTGSWSDSSYSDTEEIEYSQIYSRKSSTGDQKATSVHSEEGSVKDVSSIKNDLASSKAPAKDPVSINYSSNTQHRKESPIGNSESIVPNETGEIFDIDDTKQWSPIRHTEDSSVGPSFHDSGILSASFALKQTYKESVCSVAGIEKTFSDSAVDIENKASEETNLSVKKSDVDVKVEEEIMIESDEAKDLKQVIKSKREAFEAVSDDIEVNDRNEATIIRKEPVFEMPEASLKEEENMSHGENVEKSSQASHRETEQVWSSETKCGCLQSEEEHRKSIYSARERASQIHPTAEDGLKSPPKLLSDIPMLPPQQIIQGSGSIEIDDLERPDSTLSDHPIKTNDTEDLEYTDIAIDVKGCVGSMDNNNGSQRTDNMSCNQAIHDNASYNQLMKDSSSHKESEDNMSIDQVAKENSDFDMLIQDMNSRQSMKNDLSAVEIIRVPTDGSGSTTNDVEKTEDTGKIKAKDRDLLIDREDSNDIKCSERFSEEKSKEIRDNQIVTDPSIGDDNQSSIKSAPLLIKDDQTLLDNDQSSIGGDSLFIEDDASVMKGDQVSMEDDSSLVIGDRPVIKTNLLFMEREEAVIEGDQSMKENQSSIGNQLSIERDKKLMEGGPSLIKDTQSLIHEDQSFIKGNDSMIKSHQSLTKGDQASMEGDQQSNKSIPSFMTSNLGLMKSDPLLVKEDKSLTQSDTLSFATPDISIREPSEKELVSMQLGMITVSATNTLESEQVPKIIAIDSPSGIHPRAEEKCEPTNIPELSNSFLGVKKSKRTNKQDRRGSDWTEIKRSQSEEDGEGLGSRRRSLPISRRRLSSVSSLSDVFDAMNSLLANDLIAVRRKANQAAISVLYDDSDSDEEGEEEYKLAKKPIDVASKPGMDAFKYFLVDTPGEKLMLLWVEIERLKFSSDKERFRIIQEIRQRFFRSGAPYELNSTTLKKWNIKNVSEVGFSKLVEIQDRALEPLRRYWCARFTVHQKRRHKSTCNDYISQDHSCNKSKCSTHQREMTRVPQRPNTCFPHFRVQSANQGTPKKTSQSNTLQLSASCIIQNDASQLNTEGSRTKAKIRSKSAYPRMINTTNPKEINLCQRQLQMITTLDEGCGYNGTPTHNYKNDASNHDDRTNTRLYIQPMPPTNCKASTLIRSANVVSNEPEDRSKMMMDSLVECLLHEKHSGNFFSCYLEAKQNQLWLNCYHFWQLLQDYTEHFFTDKFSPALIKQKAGFMYSNFVSAGSMQCINCSPDLQREVYKRLDPAYEELFDKVEEHVLKILLGAFQEILTEESNQYNELNKTEELKFLDVRTRLRKPKHQPEEREEEKSNEQEDEREKISIEEVNSPLPAPADGVTFDSFIRNKAEAESFKEFLEHKNKKGLKDLLAWTEMENFRRSSHRHNQRNTMAKSVNTNWLNGDYFFGPVSPATKEAQEEVRSICKEPEMPDRPPSPVILEAQKYVRARIERRWFALFKETSAFVQRNKNPNVTEMVEDMIMKRRLQRSEAAWKILNSRWVSGSRDVVALRQVLMDPLKCLQFRKFLSLKGELMDRNVHFWLEVQKYKDLCHRHVEDSIIKSKVQAIIDVFIKSAVPPELQIDVPIEIAERLHEKASGRVPQHGPYLFREAQTTVFRIMFNHWKEFISFRASVEEEKLGQHLEELDKKHKAQNKAKKMVAERKRLARVAYEKKKKEKEEQEREKERIKMLASRAGSLSSFALENATSLISEEDEFTKSFIFSKFTSEQELQALEQRMRDEGCTVDELTEGDLTDRKTNRRSSLFLSDDQRSVSGNSVRRGRKSSDILSKAVRKESLIHEPIMERKETDDGSNNKLSITNNPKSSTELKRKQHKQNNLNSNTKQEKSNLTPERLRIRKQPDDSVSVGRISSVTDLTKSRRSQNVSLMPGPQMSSKSGVSLTKRSLREFNKSSQGKPMSVPLPLIHVTKSSNNDPVFDSGSKLAFSVSDRPKSSSDKSKKSRHSKVPSKVVLQRSDPKKDETNNIVADIIVC